MKQPEENIQLYFMAKAHPIQQLSNHSLANGTRHSTPVKLWISLHVDTISMVQSSRCSKFKEFG